MSEDWDRTCRYCVHFNGEECRRYPPIPNRGPGAAGRWPLVLAADWCGEWKGDSTIPADNV
jgi:hypothetical protein